MSTKTIVTHKNPHLDDVAAIWILQRCIPQWKKARLQFIAADHVGHALTDTRDMLHIGVGRGMFDEHKGNTKDSATSLVWKYCKKQKSCKLTKQQKLAMDEIVQYVNDEDHGLYFELPHREFMIGSVFTYLPTVTQEGSEGATAFGLSFLEAVFLGLTEKYILMGDWRKRIEFDTPWGKGVGVRTTVSSKVVARVAYSTGYELFVYKNERAGYLSVKAKNNSKVDLSAAYKALKDKEPRAEWYLHHSKKMLICGSDVANNTFLSKRSIQDLIKLIEGKIL